MCAIVGAVFEDCRHVDLLFGPDVAGAIAARRPEVEPHAVSAPPLFVRGPSPERLWRCDCGLKCARHFSEGSWRAWRAATSWRQRRKGRLWGLPSDTTGKDFGRRGGGSWNSGAAGATYYLQLALGVFISPSSRGAPSASVRFMVESPARVAAEAPPQPYAVNGSVLAATGILAGIEAVATIQP